MEKRVIVAYLVAFLLVSGAVAFFYFFAGNFTGMAIYEQKNETGFNEGTYVNTTYNGSAIVLTTNNVSGTYTSKIFDAGTPASWNNLTYFSDLRTKEYLYAVDAQGGVYSSSDSGVTWIIKNASYGRTTDTQDMFSDSLGNLYIISNTNREVWKSNNSGVAWKQINNSFSNKDLFTGGSDFNNNLYVIADATAPAGIVYKSTNGGINWVQVNSSFISGSYSARGFTSNLSNILFTVAGNGKVYSSSDSGVTWIIKNASYGRTTDTQDMFSDSLGNLYIISNTNREVWKSNNSGVAWKQINNSFSNNLLTGISDSSNNLYMIAGLTSGVVYKSSNGGVSWTQVNASYNNGNGAARGLTNIISFSNLSFQARNCSVSDCSDASWSNVDLNNIALTGRYFQYRIIFTSQQTGLTPELYNVTLDYTVLNSAPTINIVSPQNGISYAYNSPIALTYTVSNADNNLQACWYNLNNGNNISLTCGQNTTLNLSPGSYALYIYANDSYNLVSSSNANFSVTNSAPILSIASPQGGASYGYNESINLNYSVSDVNNNLESCWYNLDGLQNISLTCRQNTTFNISAGSHTLYLYANDSYNLLSNKSATFNINVGAPTIILNSPIDVYLASGNTIEFKYTPSDIDLDSCELWGNFNGTFNLNQTQVPVNGIENIFYLNLGDGNYLWNIKCNDTAGHDSTNGNKSFVVDTIKPSITINKPEGTVTTRDVPVEWIINEPNINSCWYNLYRGESIEIVNTSVDCSANSTSFTVTIDANFILNFYANDSAGNFNSANSSFSVSTSSSTTIINTGGGSRGGTTVIENKTEIIELTLNPLSRVIISKDEKKTLSLNVKNTGNVFLNKCTLAGSGGSSDWISSDETKNLAPGETADFVFSLAVPETQGLGVFNLGIVLSCEEKSAETSVEVEIIESGLKMEIANIETTTGKMDIFYKLKEMSGEKQKVKVKFLVINNENKQIAEASQEIELAENEEKNSSISINIPVDSRGEVTIIANAISEISSVSLQQKTIIGGAGLGAFAIFSEENRGKLYSGALILFCVFLIVLVVKGIIGKKERAERKGIVKFDKMSGKMSGIENIAKEIEELRKRTG